MNSYYCVVRYVPDPVRDEALNIGVIAFDETTVSTRFIQHWSRARSFGDGEIGFLQDFARQMSSAQTGRQLRLPGLGEKVEISAEGIRTIASRWTNTIQLTTPRASTLAPEALADDMAFRMLRGRAPRAVRRHRDRRTVTASTYRRVSSVFEEQMGPRGVDLLRRHVPVKGAVDDHTVDLVGKNGKLLFLAQSLAPMPSDSRLQTQQEIDAMAWVIDDIAKLQVVPVVVVTADGASPASARSARKVFGALGAEVIPEAEVVDWAGEMATSVASAVLTWTARRTQ